MAHDPANRVLAHYAQVGDVVTMRMPRGPEELEIITIRYDELP